MISVISSISNEEIFYEYLASNLSGLQIIKVSGTESLTKNYNDGIRQSVYKIKAFIHQDVDLIDGSWLIKCLKCFAEYPDTALVGLVGTKKLGKGMWWESGHEHIYGELYSGLEHADWKYNKVNTSEEVECIDGMFMMTNRNFLFDNNIEGFHLYDMDYCRMIRERGFKIRVIDHKVHHIGAIRSDKPNFEYYNKKWEL